MIIVEKPLRQIKRIFGGYRVLDKERFNYEDKGGYGLKKYDARPNKFREKKIKTNSDDEVCGHSRQALEKGSFPYDVEIKAGREKACQFVERHGRKNMSKFGPQMHVKKMPSRAVILKNGIPVNKRLQTMIRMLQLVENRLYHNEATAVRAKTIQPTQFLNLC